MKIPTAERECFPTVLAKQVKKKKLTRRVPEIPLKSSVQRNID